MAVTVNVAVAGLISIEYTETVHNDTDTHELIERADAQIELLIKEAVANYYKVRLVNLATHATIAPTSNEDGPLNHY